MNSEPKRLCKSRTNRMLAGVCGGLSEYLNLDPTIVRIVWAFVCCFGGSGLLFYIIAAVIMPEAPQDTDIYG